ncbi:hypothetical protein DBV05_g11132 [Lasiodiplodia theobromae]|uniref:Ubiquitin-like protease family profile domain-containing protein n=1 Tax=Lasiodiplodia theobromae TaxID=45133 RepID=A0A5N5CXW2_9PEZI|nr:hypothetical protein DBV05_g11132 [Lasiodiplodia theobromae]
MKQYDIHRKSGRPESYAIGLGIACVTEAISQKGAFKFALYDVFKFELYLQCIVGEIEEEYFVYDSFKLRRTRSPIYVCYTDFEELETMDAGTAAHDGHHILATAHLEPDSNGKLVKKIRYYDSAPHWLKGKRRDVFKKTQAALKQWGGSDSKWVCEWVPVLHQGEEACGIHVILNAWTLALGLQPYDHPKNMYFDEFYDDAARLISCAVHGEVSSDLIMAFFRCWDFLDDPDSEPLPGREFNRTHGVHDEKIFADETVEAPRMSLSPPGPAVALSGAGGSSTAAAQILGPDQLSTSRKSSNETIYVDSEGDLSDLDSQDEGNPDKKHDHDEENNPDQGDDSNEEQGSNEQHSRPFWPEGAEKYPCRFLEESLRRADRIADLVKERENPPDDVNGPFIKLNNRWMWCASIASVTEAISLNGYEQNPYLDSEIDGDGMEDRDYTVRDYEKDFTEDQKEDAEDFMAAVKKKQKEHRTEKRVFSFYGRHCLKRAELNGKKAPAFGVLRRMEPIMIPISRRHLVYATSHPEEELPMVTHYWVESLESPGLPNRRERFIQEDIVRVLLKDLNWGPEQEVEKRFARNDIWNLVSPVDPNLLLPPQMRQEKEVAHLVLTAWTIALGFRPPSTPVITADHSDHYSKIDYLILRAAQGLVDSATIFAGLRCLGWIPKGVLAPPESVRFDRTMSFGWNPDDMSDYYDYKRREVPREELQARLKALKGRFNDASEKLGEARREYEERYDEPYDEDNVSRRSAMTSIEEEEDELAKLIGAAEEAYANEKAAREMLDEEREGLKRRIAELKSLDVGCRGHAIWNDTKTPAKALDPEGEDSEYGDEWLRHAELEAAKRAFEDGKSRYGAAIKNLPVTMAKDQDEGLRRLHAPEVQELTAAADTPTRLPPQAPLRTTPPATEDGGTASAAEDPRGLKRSYEEFADERLVVDPCSDEYDELKKIHYSGKGLHRTDQTERE